MNNNRWEIPTKQHVEAAIQKELKDVEYTSKFIQVADTKIAPYQSTIDRAPFAHRNVVTPFYLYSVEFQSDVESLNHRILSNLENGASGLKILIEDSQEIDADYFEKILKGVRLDYIYTVLDSENPDHIHYFENFIQSLPFEVLPDRLFSKYYSISSTQFYQLSKKAIEIDENIWYNIELTGDFYRDLCTLRAFRILKNGYMIKTNNSSSYILTASTMPPEANLQNPQNYLLNLSTQAVAAILGNVDGLEISKIGSENKDFDERMSRNIFNLLQEESYLTLVDDPARGSYFIEKYTEIVAKKIYES